MQIKHFRGIFVLFAFVTQGLALVCFYMTLYNNTNTAINHVRYCNRTNTIFGG